MPGPYIKWFSHVDLPRVLEGYECKRAYAQSCVAFSVGPGSVPLVFTGRAHGVIVDAPRGDAGFGWDACFKPDGHDATFAEMDAATKNGISHRSRALEQLSNYLKGDADLLVALCAERVMEAQEPEDRFFFHRRRKEI
ncbi:NADH pyrophosphatase [Aureococcus anophagefferens]|nr:NADH pyrophosphatase [Aureococcus anophagefferens]